MADDSMQKYFPLIRSSTEKLWIASTLDALRDAGRLPQGTTTAAFISLCFSRGLNEYMKEVVDAE
jgi:hypothetical protein